MSALALGENARARAIAIEALRAAIPVFERALDTVPRVEFGHQLALARVTLALALTGSEGGGEGDRRAEARDQAALARAWYLGVRQGHSRRLDALDAQGFQVLK
jgi:hypothetical protein